MQGGRRTSHKTRFVAHGQQMLRVDREDTKTVHPKLAERLLRITREAMTATSVTVLSDYRKGVLAGDTARALIAGAAQIGRKTVAGTRGPDFARFAGANVLATGWPDLARLGARPVESDAAVADAATELARAHLLGAVVVVRSGMSVSLVHGFLDGAGPQALHFRNRAVDVLDVSGTGDTVLAVLGAALAVGLDLPIAARIANLAASIVVERVGTAVARRRDLLSVLERPAGGRILDMELAVDRVERWRRAGLRAGLAHGTFDPADDAAMAGLETARAACDRLIVALAPSPAQRASAEALAALAFVDLVVLTDGEKASLLVQALRPELLVEADGAGAAGGELVRGWGGRVMAAGR